MGPDRDMAKVMGEATGLVCLECGMAKCLAEIYEASTSVGEVPAGTDDLKG